MSASWLTLAVLLGVCAPIYSCVGLGLRRDPSAVAGPGQGLAKVWLGSRRGDKKDTEGHRANEAAAGSKAFPQEQECKELRQLPQAYARTLHIPDAGGSLQASMPAFSCYLGRRNATMSGVTAGHSSEAVCSPVCDDAQDVVVVLGSSEWKLEDVDIANSRTYAKDLLKHFGLSRARGSLFGFLDVSRGAGHAASVAPLGEDRKALHAALDSWQPLAGGEAVTSMQLQGLENRPEVLAMLKTSRSSVRRTLLVLQPPPREGAAPPAQKSHLGLIQAGEDPFKKDKEIMELLVSACPAVRIDPDLACGRMRWGSTEDNGNDKLTPWGKPTK